MKNNWRKKSGFPGREVMVEIFYSRTVRSTIGQFPGKKNRIIHFNLHCWMDMILFT